MRFTSGRLVRVLPDHHARGASLYVVYPSRKNVPARVTAFRDFVVEAFASWAAGRDGGRGAIPPPGTVRFLQSEDARA